ncbi:MAG: hypothetical protein KQI35_16250 [Bacteroidetes bacterium]|nr:hypothetical protein [Bacteroidota bacterium]
MILWIIFPILLLADPRVEKNPHVVYHVSLNDDQYLIEYTFMDPFGNLQTYSLTIPHEGAVKMIDKFGIPMWMFEPYVDTEDNLAYRKEILKKGLFRLHENTIEVDKSAVVQYYSEAICKPIAKMIIRSLADYNMDTPRNRIEFAMRFVQDIPYGIPLYEDDDRHYGGVSPPPKLLIDGYGDCDSKVLLFAGILVYLIPVDDFIFLNQLEHVLSAIRAEPDKGLTFVRFEGDRFLIAETAGPGKRLLGQEGTYFRNKFVPEKLQIDPPEILPPEKAGLSTSYRNTSKTNNTNTITIRNTSNRRFSFQISNDQVQWKKLQLTGKQSGQFEMEAGSALFIRFRERNSRYVIHKISPGNTYSLIWDPKKNKWEIAQ